MSDTVSLALSFVPALATGVVLGTFFYGGLWWTTQKAVLSKTPGLWFVVSMLVRTTVALTGFYFVALGSWERLLTCLLGLIMARAIIIRVTARPGASHQSTTKDDSHAS